MTEKTKIYLGCDPGGTAGMCGINEKMRVEFMDQVSDKDFNKYLAALQEKFELIEIIVEDYVQHKKKAGQMAGSRFVTVQQIGKLDLQANLLGIKFTKQMSGILGIAEKWTGVKLPHTHSETHKFSAYLHVCYYLIRAGKMQTKLQKEMAAKRDA